MDSREIIVSDESILKGLSSDNNELLEASQIIIEFLCWRKHCKHIITIPAIYGRMFNKVKDFEELKAYYQNYFRSAEFLGIGDKNPDYVEFNSLIYNLWVRGFLIILVTDDTKLIEMIPKMKHVHKTVIKSVIGMKNIIMKKKAFYDMIYAKYYDSSA